MPAEVAQVTRRALPAWSTAARPDASSDTYRDNAEEPLAARRQDGYRRPPFQSHRLDGGVRSAKVMNRAATFAFYIGDRFTAS
ncbi:MAG: hypothetical protein IPF44_09650 [Betaproteobacteria bacterium]|nr:hypothetical protein [Betaproteobacteria bacterium]